MLEDQTRSLRRLALLFPIHCLCPAVRDCDVGRFVSGVGMSVVLRVLRGTSTRWGTFVGDRLDFLLRILCCMWLGLLLVGWLELAAGLELAVAEVPVVASVNAAFGSS